MLKRQLLININHQNNQENLHLRLMELEQLNVIHDYIDKFNIFIKGFAKLPLNASDLLVFANQYGLLPVVVLLQFGNFDKAFALEGLQLVRFFLFIFSEPAEGLGAGAKLLDEL